MDPMDLRVLTLNCWGVRFLSSKRRERIACIGNTLSRSEYDIIALQEIWCKEDFELLSTKMAQSYPHAHYFQCGKWSVHFLQMANRSDTLSQFSSKSYPGRILDAGWFGGKGFGLTVVRHPEHGLLSVINTHFNHKPKYCRVAQALQLCQFIRAMKSQHLLVCGDFNDVPTSEVYQLMTQRAGLHDSQREDEDALRIDYVFHKSDSICSNKRLKCTGSTRTMGKIPGLDMCYSDHEAVRSDFVLSDSETERSKETGSAENLADVQKIISDALKATENTYKKLSLISRLLFIAWIVLWLSSVPANLLQNVLLAATLIIWISATFFTKGEASALAEIKSEITVLDYHDD